MRSMRGRYINISGKVRDVGDIGDLSSHNQGLFHNHLHFHEASQTLTPKFWACEYHSDLRLSIDSSHLSLLRNAIAQAARAGFRSVGGNSMIQYIQLSGMKASVAH